MERTKGGQKNVRDEMENKRKDYTNLLSHSGLGNNTNDIDDSQSIVLS